MENIKALEVAREIVVPPIYNGSLMDAVHHVNHEKNITKAFKLIQAAIDEATQAERTMCDRLAEALVKASDIAEHPITNTQDVEAVRDECHLILTAYTAHKKGR